MANNSGNALLVGIGNPLLDISTEVSADIYTKYDLKPGNAIMAEPKHLPLYEELKKNHKVDYIAGGACQNSMRACQWMSSTPGLVHYIGCVGNDDNAKHLTESTAEYGLTTHYLVDSEKPTGTCAVCVHNKERSLVANLGAAEAYKMSHFQSAEIQALVNKAQFFYPEGFFLTHSTPVVVELGKHAAQHNKVFTINLCAPFLIDFFFDNLSQVLPFADVVFCNDDEAATLGKKMNWGTDLDVIAKNLSAFNKVNTQRSRTVVFTQGSKATIVYKDGNATHYPVPPVPKEEIVDTNGAGDSFVGGFLSRFIQGKSIEECVAAGHYCAAECIRRSGATYPAKSSFHFP